MAGWTIVNVKDEVEDSAERSGLAPSMEARFGRKPLELEGGGFSYQRLAPGFTQPFGHRHERHEEVYVVLAGSGRVKLEDETRELRQWDALRVAGPVARGFAAGQDGMELLVIGFGEGGDTEMLDTFWAES